VAPQAACPPGEHEASLAEVVGEQHYADGRLPRIVGLQQHRRM
jgi:hypothetical protein